MNAAYVMGARADRRLRADRVLRRDPRRRGRRQGREPAVPRLHLATTATSTPNARPRSASPTAASSSCRTSASCRSAITRTPTTRCFSGRRASRSRKNTTGPEATANAAISARLPYLMATSRFAHYLKVMARDRIGSFMEAPDVERRLNRWIKNYVNANESARPGDEGAGSRCARRGSRSRRSPAGPAPTTRSPICGRGCRWRS